MKYAKHFDHWTVIYTNGARAYFKSEEAARHEAFMHGRGLIAPLYR
jgi:hypothetical protein